MTAERSAEHADPRKAAAIGFLGMLPLLVTAWVSLVAARSGDYAVDFRDELYPEAQLVLHGRNPFPSAHAALHFPALIWPVPAALLGGPFTAASAHAAGVVYSVLLAAALLATPWVMGVRDWRVYGIVALWPSGIASVQAGNVTPLLALLLAVAWATRSRRILPGVAIGLCVALKLFLFPMVVWLVATRRWAAAAAATALSLATVLSVLPFIGLAHYLTLMHRMGETFGPPGVGLVGLLSQSGMPFGAAEALAALASAALLALAFRRRSFVLALAGSLVLSPIVWLHYYALLTVPLAYRYRTLSWAWAIPLAMWCCTDVAAGSVSWKTAVALASSAAAIAVSELASMPRVILSARRQLMPALNRVMH